MDPWAPTPPRGAKTTDGGWSCRRGDVATVQSGDQILQRMAGHEGEIGERPEEKDPLENNDSGNKDKDVDRLSLFFEGGGGRGVSSAISRGPPAIAN